jgi:hypothetical protein
MKAEAMSHQIRSFRVRTHRLRVLRAVALAALLAAAASLPVGAQAPAGRAPRAAKPQAPAPAGQPNFQGDWDPLNTGTFDLTDPRTGGSRLDEILNERAGQVRLRKPSRVIDPSDGKIPYQPWAAARQAVLAAHMDSPTRPEHIDSQARCLPGGVPREMFHSQTRILQTNDAVIIQQAQNHVFRVIPLDNRPALDPRITLWMGDSRGHFEGNTLVVDVRNQNAKGRFDMVGNFASDRIHVVERWTLVDASTIRYEARIEDPTVYTRPWTVGATLKRGIRGEGEEYWEDACHEGERSADAMIIRTGEASSGTAP